MLVFNSYTFLSLVARMTWIIYFNGVLLPITTQLERNAFFSWNGQSYPVYIFHKSAYLDSKLNNKPNLLGWPKRSFIFFLSKNKWHIVYFHQKLYWHHIHWFVPLASAIFSSKFIIPSFQNFFFWAKNCFRCFLKSLRELKFFPLRIL